MAKRKIDTIQMSLFDLLDDPTTVVAQIPATSAILTQLSPAEASKDFHRRYGDFPDCWDHLTREEIKNDDKNIKVEVKVAVGDDGAWWHGYGMLAHVGDHYSASSCQTRSGPHATRARAIAGSIADLMQQLECERT